LSSDDKMVVPASSIPLFCRNDLRLDMAVSYV
jgi:hypothetical protein